MPKTIDVIKPPKETEGNIEEKHLVLVAKAVTELLKIDDDKLGTIAGSLKAELTQLIKDAKSGYLTARQSAARDFIKRVNNTINSANDLLAKGTASKSWTFEDAKLSAPPDMKLAADDLVDLLKKAGNLYATKIGTVVGGSEAKSGKKIDGLNYPSARIDVQSPPAKGYHNVQFQIGKASVACVLFADEDELKEVEANLKESLKKKKKAVSPASQSVK
ncbi:MAG: hypothetical protein AB7Q97_24985 [Gammaproteobacteria bacterium]